MSELASLLGLPVDYEYEGKTYRVSMRSIRVEAAMEVWAENAALDAIERQRTRLSAEAYEKLLTIWERDVAASDVYCFDGEVVTRAVRFPGPGQKHLAWLQLVVDQGQKEKATPELVDRIFRDERDRFGAYKRLLQAMARADGRMVPNVEEATTARGSPDAAA